MIQNYWSRFFSSKFFLAILISVTVLMSYSIFKEKKDQQAISKNIKSLEQEITSLESKSLNLAEIIKYLRSDDYVDKEAREKLVMKKQDEKVVIVPENKGRRMMIDTEKVIKTNWKLWIDYFFAERR